MSQAQRRTKGRHSATLSTKSSALNREHSIPIPSRQGELNEQTDFASDPSLMFDELPQPFRRINKVLQSIFDDAWTLIEQREQQRTLDQSKFVSAQHTSSTSINTPYPVSLLGSHSAGTLAFFNGIDNDQSYLICYDSQVDEITNQMPIEHPLQQMVVLKFEAIYFLSVIDQLGYWRMFAYKNQKYYLLFTQYEAEDESKRPLCLMTQTGLNDDYLLVSWFGNNDSWVEIYKLTKDQWKAEIAAQEQTAATNEADIVEDAVQPSAETSSGLIRGQFTRPSLLFKTRAPKFSAGTNNFQQLMKNTENQSNVGQGIANHFYTQQIIDTKTILIRDLILSGANAETPDRAFAVPKNEPLPPIIPNFAFIPAGAATAGGTHSMAISWPTTNQLLVFKLAKSEAKGKDAFETRPTSVWPFSTRITSLTYDSKHEHLAVALLSGNVCIIERTAGVNDLPSVQHVSPYPIVDAHAIDSLETAFNVETKEKRNGFLVLSTAGQIYRVHFRSLLSEDKTAEQQPFIPCFPQEQSKDTSKILRMLFFNCNPANLFLSVNERNRIYVNDALKSKQLCEIVIPELARENSTSFQIALIDNARSLIVGVSEAAHSSVLRLYRVPLEHFPSLATYYPERIPSTTEETLTPAETKPTKAIASQTKKGTVAPEIDKTALLFDERIKELFRQRHVEVEDRQERLRARWGELKLHLNPVHEQSV